MKAKLIAIGNSKGVRIPRAVLEQCGLNGEGSGKVNGEVEMDVRDGVIVIRPVRSARQGWEEAFAKMRQRGDDKLPDAAAGKPSVWDQKEWTW